MKITYNVAMEVASHEAIIRQAYKDSVGKWTWSVGLTSATGHVVERYIAKPQSLEHCLRVYVWALDNYADPIREYFKDTPLTEEQFAGILSFVWNLGVGVIKTAKFFPAFKRGDMKAAEASLRSHNKAGKKVAAGLNARRKAEADLIFRGKWSHTGTMTEYTKLNIKSHTPVWSSGKRINVEKELRDILKDEIPASDKVIVEKEVVPEKVEESVKDAKEKVGTQSKLGAWLSTIFGSLGTAIAAIMGMDWQTLAVLAGSIVALLLVILLLHNHVISIINKVQEAVDD